MAAFYKPNLVFTTNTKPGPESEKALTEALQSVEDRTRGAIYRHCALYRTGDILRWFLHIDVLGVRKRLVAFDPRFAFCGFDDMQNAKAEAEKLVQEQPKRNTKKQGAANVLAQDQAE